MRKPNAIERYQRIIRIKLTLSFMIALILIMIGLYYLTGIKI
jgi:hypothetical protein